MNKKCPFIRSLRILHSLHAICHHIPVVNASFRSDSRSQVTPPSHRQECIFGWTINIQSYRFVSLESRSRVPRRTRTRRNVVVQTRSRVSQPGCLEPADASRDLFLSQSVLQIWSQKHGRLNGQPYLVSLHDGRGQGSGFISWSAEAVFHSWYSMMGGG